MKPLAKLVRTDVQMPRDLYRQRISPVPEVTKRPTHRRAGWFRAIKAVVTGSRA